VRIAFCKIALQRAIFQIPYKALRIIGRDSFPRNFAQMFTGVPHQTYPATNVLYNLSYFCQPGD